MKSKILINPLEEEICMNVVCYYCAIDSRNTGKPTVEIMDYFPETPTELGWCAFMKGDVTDLPASTSKEGAYLLLELYLHGDY